LGRGRITRPKGFDGRSPSDSFHSLTRIGFLSFCDEEKCYELAEWQVRDDEKGRLLCSRHTLLSMRSPRRWGRIG
jgi:hypothetical protein